MNDLASPQLDVSQFPLPQWLMLELLIARWVLGDRSFTFPQQAQRTVQALADVGLVGFQPSGEDGSVVVWLTKKVNVADAAPQTPPATFTNDGHVRSGGAMSRAQGAWCCRECQRLYHDTFPGGAPLVVALAPVRPCDGCGSDQCAKADDHIRECGG